jgi:ubiquinone/menaquinone biosynthesis C-methylase UbiE
MVRHEAWQLEGSAAELYERHLVPAITSLWAADLVERAALQPGERVLDVACGTGIVARRAAERMGSGRVVGLDINPGMLAVARSLPSGPGPAIEWHDGSALDMPFPEGSFDVCLCQLGLQFFPDRAAALREMRRVLRTGGRLALSVFDAIEDTAVTNALADALDRRVGPGASAVKRAEHSLCDPEELRGLATAAGFGDAAVQGVPKTIRLASPRLYVEIQLTATPMASLVARLEHGAREALVDAVAQDVATALGGAIDREFTSPTRTLVFTARNSALRSHRGARCCDGPDTLSGFLRLC